jgi:hypothetical protein
MRERYKRPKKDDSKEGFSELENSENESKNE